MTSNNKNNEALWSNIRKIKKKNKIYSDWVDLLACEIWKCKKDKDGNDEPILNENGKLPESRIDILEESLVSSDSDTSSMDSLDEDIEQLKEDIQRLNDRTLYYATEQHLNEVEEMGRDNQQRLNVIGGQIDDLEVRANAMEADRDALEARIVAIEGQRSGTGGTGGGKRRKRTRVKLRVKSRVKSRKKRRKKKTKKRRRKKKN